MRQLGNLLWLQTFIFGNFYHCLNASLYVGESVREALENEFSFVVGIGHKRPVGDTENIFCTGSLISRRHVLTAAHCIIRKPVENLQVYVGSVDKIIANKYFVNDTITFLDWAYIYDHPHDFPDNDIAIIMLDEQVRDDQAIGTLSYVPNSELFDKEATLIGWGAIHKGFPSEYLRTASTNIMFPAECEQNLKAIKWDPEFVLPENILCTSSLPLVVMTHGDSGGPLILEESSFPKRHVIVGVAVAQIHDDTDVVISEQNAFMDVYHYKNFIHDILNTM